MTAQRVRHADGMTDRERRPRLERSQKRAGVDIRHVARNFPRSEADPIKTERIVERDVERTTQCIEHRLVDLSRPEGGSQGRQA